MWVSDKQKKALNPFELDLQMVIRCPLEVLGTLLWFSVCVLSVCSCPLSHFSSPKNCYIDETRFHLQIIQDQEEHLTMNAPVDPLYCLCTQDLGIGILISVFQADYPMTGITNKDETIVP